MRVSEVRTTPLLVPYVRPYYWAQGVVSGASVVLVEIHTDEGIVGYGESIGSAVPAAIEAYVREAGRGLIGESPFANGRLMAQAYSSLFQARGTCSAPRFGAQVLAGLEMALWDVAGKATGRPVHELLGGAVHDGVGYFGFAQGETAAEVAADARELAQGGFDVIYVKVGRGDELDLEIVSAVRAAIGPDQRLRVDANEHWSPAHALRMAQQLAGLGVEMLEQPTPHQSIPALAQVRATSPIAIAADQAVFTQADAYEVCRQQAADMIVVGVHEAGGLLPLTRIAHVAEAAGIPLCIHGLYETGITTCAAREVAVTIPNLDDANQHMTRFLEYDVVKTPDLGPRSGRLPVNDVPGLGFELDLDAVAHAHEGRMASGSYGGGYGE